MISFNSMQKPRNYDVNAGLIAYASIAVVQIIEREDSELMTLIDTGTNPMNIEPVHPSTDTATVRKRRFRRKLIRLSASEGDLKVIRKILYPVWHWLKFESGHTPKQMADYLDISLTTLQRINSRFQALHKNLDFIDADNQYLLDVD